MNTKEDWWGAVEENWDALKEIIETFHPAKNNRSNLPITAFQAENVRKEIASKIKDLEDYEVLREDKDPKLSKVLNDTYWGIPESTSCWNYKGFGVLCDLCSESYLAYEE